MRFATILDCDGQSKSVFQKNEAAPWMSLQTIFETEKDANLDQAIKKWDHFFSIVKDWNGKLEPIDLTEANFLPATGIPPTFRDFYAFEDHVKTARARRNLKMIPAWYEIPTFYFSNPHSIVGHGSPIYAPADSSELDYELEVGAIIGREGRDISQENAWGHIAGFTIINDFSARDLQRLEMKIGLGPAKGKDFATAVGPYLVTRDEIEDCIDKKGRLNLAMTARINGKVYSQGNASSMYYTWPQLLEHAAKDVTLQPGDLIGSGTVGSGCILELGPENTGGWLKPGDVVELEIERLGVLRTAIAARPEQ